MTVIMGVFRNRYPFRCAGCGREVTVMANAAIKAHIFLHSQGWASTSLHSRTASILCQKCADGRDDLKRSPFTNVGHTLGKWAQ